MTSEQIIASVVGVFFGAVMGAVGLMIAEMIRWECEDRKDRREAKRRLRLREARYFAREKGVGMDGKPLRCRL